MVRRRIGVAAAVVAGALLGAGTQAHASVGIGGTAGASNNLILCGSGLFLEAAEGTGPSYAIPSGGIITSWSMMGPGAATNPVAMKVARTVNPTTFKITGTTAMQTIAPNVLNTFRVRVPVGAGDRIALWTDGPSASAQCAFSSSSAGDQLRFGSPATEPAIGTDVTAGSGASSIRLNLSAQLEPDADGDGYGDETQDDCPAEPLAHELPCDRTAPETAIANAPGKLKAKGKTASVSISFSSSESGSTFTCTLDGKSSACSSPFTAKVKKGSHHFSVAATDAAGNADATSAEADFTVKAKKKKPKRAG